MSGAKKEATVQEDKYLVKACTVWYTHLLNYMNGGNVENISLHTE